jgi:DNA-binding MarR family transcriptional regulator
MRARKDKEKELIQDLAWFRYNLRRFLRFSEKAARACGVTPQQHQLMLGIAGFTENGRATVSDLAEFLQERNNSVVGLVERAAESGLVRRQAGKTDRRQVVVSVTAKGEEILSTLTQLHHDELRRIQAGFLTGTKLQRKPVADRAKARRGRGEELRDG